MAFFLVDLMLLRLGRWLRLIGQDVAIPNRSFSDRELLQKAKTENRTLLTADKRLAEECRAAGVDCILIKTFRIEGQLEEIEKLGIPLELDPRRCTLCNGPLQKVDCQELATWQCESCGKLYWKGSHWKKMEKMLESIRDNIDKSNINDHNIDVHSIENGSIDSNNINNNDIGSNTNRNTSSNIGSSASRSAGRNICNGICNKN